MNVFICIGIYNVRSDQNQYFFINRQLVTSICIEKITYFFINVGLEMNVSFDLITFYIKHDAPIIKNFAVRTATRESKFHHHNCRTVNECSSDKIKLEDNC